MPVEKTLSIIKPDAVGDNNVGKILQRFEDKNLEIVASKMIRLSKEKAEGFYSIHKDKPFFTVLSFLILLTKTLSSPTLSSGVT